MAQTSPRLMLPFLQAAQAQKHVTHNEALERLDVLAQLTVEMFDATTPPIAPSEGEVWALGIGAVNDWAGHDLSLAAWMNGGWVFVAPMIGWRATHGTDLRVWTGTDWAAPDLPPLQNLTGLGVNTTYDATNRLAVSADATLLTHDGQGHQLKLNKSGTTDTASLLFQTGWSGRAEMGTAGNDDFAIKVSADGLAWFEALLADGGSGQVTLPEGALLPPGAAPSPSLGFVGDADTGLWSPGADQLAIGTQGSERLRITNAGVQVSGLMTGTALTQSATDQTAGRLLKVGDFGLGATLTLGAGDDLDTLSASGLYYNPTSGNTPGNHYPITSAGALLNLRRTATNWSQIFISYAGNSLAADLRQFTRSYGVNGWCPWVETIHQGRIVGTVSQNAGVPTGSVIERGSNANGAYVRFADGTQICTRSFSLGSILAVGNGTFATPYATASATWTFPASFAALPRVSGSALAGTGGIYDRAMHLNITSVSATSAGSINAVRTAGSAVDLSPTASLIAIGTWF